VTFSATGRRKKIEAELDIDVDDTSEFIRHSAEMQTPERTVQPAKIPQAPMKPKRTEQLPAHRLTAARNLMDAFLDVQSPDIEETSRERS
jgi:hypothetical protein